jgi:hypothetical protein
MSLEFNRRSFLKYSAAAAVAVAGSSLLVGCGEDEYQKTGKIGSTLKLMGTFRMYDNPAPTFALDSVGATNGTFTCKLNIKCTTKKVPLYVAAGCFQLTVIHDGKKTNYADSGYVTVDKPNFKLAEKDDAEDFTITVKGNTSNPLNIVAGDKVEFMYWPRIQASSGNSGYTRAFCTWKMAAKANPNDSSKIILE